MSGAAKALLVIGAILVLGLGGCAVLAGVLIDRGADRLGEAAGDLVPSEDGCPFLSAEEATRTIGPGTTLLELRGLASLADFALDNRALPDAPSCMFTTEGDDGTTGRIARLSSSDAAEVFAAERTKAGGLREDRGNGLSVETDDYFAKDVDLGDEAFCTAAGVPPSSGVLVRRRDVVVYVSLLPDRRQLDGIGVDSEGTGLSFDEENCERAQVIARAVIDD
jgi:hypothetical protein